MRATTKSLLNKIIFFLLFFISYISHSQFYHGLEVGMNMTNADFMIGESVEPSSATGFFLGYLAERDLSDNLYVRLGFNFNRRQFNAISRRGINTTEEKWGIDAIEIPINLGYYVNWNNRNFQFFVDAGINLGYNSRVITKNDEETIRLDIGGDADVKRIAIGANAGVGLLIKKRIKVRFNYYNSLTNIINTEGNVWKNKTFGVSLNYFLREKQVY
ncbi:MAG: PorT family protein [Flavobacteriaceae bacterium]|nr:PorT family protein [Flavobacteriaceae bacterium]